jgi:5-aminopentanamidase
VARNKGTPMRIACFQGPKAADTVQGNLTLLAETAQQARSAGADLLITPELFLTGYAIGAAKVARLAEPQHGPALARVADIARSTGIAIILGYPERTTDAIFNAATAFDAAGQQIAHYRKTHLFGPLDRAQFSAGQTPATLFELGGLKIGLLICYDVEFPENTRHLALLGGRSGGRTHRPDATL